MDNNIGTMLSNWFNKNYEINDNNKIKVIGKSRYLTEHDVYHTYQQVMSNLGMDYATPIEFSNWMATQYKVIAKPVKSANAVSTWIEDKLMDKSCMYRLSNNGRQVEYGNGITWVNADHNDVLSWLREINDKDNGGPGYSVGTIKDSFANILKHGEYKAVGIIQQHIIYDKSKEEFLNAFLEQLYNYWDIEESYDIFQTLMKQWMWCLKRKIWNREVRHHIWINFFGTTGYGKSQFIKRFLKEFESFYVQGGLEIFSDQGREYKKFCNNFVLFFDELSQNNQSALADAKLSESTLAAIKASITGETMDVRILGSQDQNKIKIRYTPISAANYHLFDIIYDETSMRRFFEFNIGRTIKPTEADFKKINSILEHSVEAFKGIDENNDIGYFQPETPVGKRITEIQQKYLPTKTTVNVWIRKCHVKKGNTPSDMLYDEYKTWCKSFGYNPRNLDGYNAILRSQFGCDEGGSILIDVDHSDTSTANNFVKNMTTTNTSFDDIEV